MAVAKKAPKRGQSRAKKARMRGRLGRQGLFTDQQVKAILKDLAGDMPAIRVAAKWGCSYNTINNIKWSITYLHVPRPEGLGR